ncbi:hypothetical protein ACMDCR_09870 [Labrys okinawensis]|uniref:hypothetical protein n=1 Tax=Labrys okinawensis TaxID=346911 RepID=UPI0039BD8E0B
MPLCHSARTVKQKRRIEYVPQSVRQYLNPALNAEYFISRRLRQAGRDHSSAAIVAALAQVF